MKLAIIGVAVALTGCAHFDSIRLEEEHVSHPFAGPPFGPPNEEDCLDHVVLLGRYVFEHNLYVDMGLGYKYVDEGLYGPKLSGTVRVGGYLWKRQ